MGQPLCLSLWAREFAGLTLCEVPDGLLGDQPNDKTLAESAERQKTLSPEDGITNSWTTEPSLTSTMTTTPSLRYCLRPRLE